MDRLTRGVLELTGKGRQKRGERKRVYDQDEKVNTDHRIQIKRREKDTH